MENIDCYLTKNISEYLYPYEKLCFLHVNKDIYQTFIRLQIKIKNLSFKSIIPTNILFWLIDNLKLNKKFQIECCDQLLYKKEIDYLYNCLSNKNFKYSSNFLYSCLTNNVDDFILRFLMKKNTKYNILTIHAASLKNKINVLKWCFKNKHLCKDDIEILEYDLIEHLCSNINIKRTTIELLMKNNFRVNRECLFSCISLGNLKVFKFILDKIKYDLSVNFTPHELINYSNTLNMINFSKYIRELYQI